MAKTLTKAQLLQQLEEAHVAYQRLEARLLSAQPTPAATKTVAARKPHEPCTCGKCGGSGWYDEAEGRICFQCQGKGIQDDADQRRNWGYARHRNADRGNRVSSGAYRIGDAELEARRAAMAAAKAAAIAGGKSVVVSYE